MGIFRFLTAGESHGKGLVAIIEGLPAGILINEDLIVCDMARRQSGYGRGERMKIERDSAEIISGVRLGLTIGSPISLFIENRDWDNWQQIMSVTPTDEQITTVTAFRPGHADLAGVMKYGLDDIRSVLERASARETASRVAVGSICRCFLNEFAIRVQSHTVAIGNIKVNSDIIAIDWEQVEHSPLRCNDADAEKKMIAAIDDAQKAGDSLGGIFEVVATGVPPGLGSHIQWDRKLNSRIAQAMMSINAVKGVEIGAGFAASERKGSQVHDVIEPASEEQYWWKRKSNNAGGIEGGMSNGEPVVVRCAIKPIPTLIKPLDSIDMLTGEAIQSHIERSDICVVPAAGVVGEAMLAIVLTEAMLEKFGGDNVKETRRNFENYIKSIAERRKLHGR